MLPHGKKTEIGNSTYDNAAQNQFTAYLSTAVRNSKARYEKKSAQQMLSEVSLEENEILLADKSDFLLRMVQFHEFSAALHALDTRERCVVTAHIIYEEDFATIARRLGISYKGAASIYYRAIKTLRNRGELYDV